MADDATKADLDRTLIVLDEPRELWTSTKALGADAQTLRAAAAAVGSWTEMVRAHQGKK